MKLATIKNGTRDGRLCVVSKDLARAVFADDIAATLLRAVEQWPAVESALRARSDKRNAGFAAAAFAFDASLAMSPLGRAMTSN